MGFRPPLFLEEGGGTKGRKFSILKAPVEEGGRKDENFKIKSPGGGGGTKGRKIPILKAPAEV